MEILKLTNENIDLLSDTIGEVYAKAGCTKKECFRAKLLLEEALLKYQSRFGEDTEFYYRSYKIFGQLRFTIRIRTASFDPFTLEENPMAFMIQSVMSSFENGMPTWKYKNLENEIAFSIRKKAVLNSVTKLLIALVVAAIIAIIVKLLVPQEIIHVIVTDYLQPLTNAYAGLFCVMAVLLTLFAITMSIVHVGDMAAVGAIGGKIMKRFILVSAIAAVILTIPVLPFFKITGIGEISIAAKSVYDILIGFIPQNLVAPFLDFNSVHIMIIGAMFGFSLLAMGQQGENITKVFNECHLVAIYTNNFLNKFIFIYVAITLFNVITDSDFSQLAGAGKMLIFIIIAEILLAAFYAIYTCLKTKRNFKTYVHSIAPATIVCLTSANFGAVFSTVFDSMIEADVDSDIMNFSVNLGSVFFQPACTMVFIISSIFMADAYGVPITGVWLLTSVVLSIILVCSMPNIPGAAVAVITLLYTQLGIPAEGLALIIAINAILQFLTVGVDAWCLQSEILCLDYSHKKKLQKIKQ